MGDVINILVLCTGNSARSILAEAILNRLGAGRVRAFSAGSRPAGAVNPHAADLLLAKGYDMAAFSSKSWDVFAGADAPRMDMVITVCDSAAGETCPLWPGAPLRVHWGFPDPAGATGTPDEIARTFEEVYGAIHARMEKLIRALDSTIDRVGADGDGAAADLISADLASAVRAIG